MNGGVDGLPAELLAVGRRPPPTARRRRIADPSVFILVTSAGLPGGKLAPASDRRGAVGVAGQQTPVWPPLADRRGLLRSGYRTSGHLKPPSLLAEALKPDPLLREPSFAFEPIHHTLGQGRPQPRQPGLGPRPPAKSLLWAAHP